MTSSREAIFQALFALVSLGEGQPGQGAVSWTAAGAPQTLAWTSRRVRLWADAPAQPALCQAEPDEEIAQASGMPYRRTLSAAWIVYHQAGADPAAAPTSVNNAILDALEAALAPDDLDERCTLGGLVWHCFIDGKVFKDAGDLDEQALLVVPIKLLAP